MHVRPGRAQMTPSRFDEITRDDLSRASSRKWSLHPGTIGAWVAEMDFGTAPAVTAALHQAVETGDLGYLAPSTTQRMAEATAAWLREDYGWTVPPENIHRSEERRVGKECPV